MKHHKLTKFHKAAIVIVIAVAIAYAAGYAANNAEKMAIEYYNKSYFVSGSKTKYAAVITDDGEVIEYIRDNDSLLIGFAQRGGDAKPAKAVEISEDLVRHALERAGVKGELLGTYVYNSTHLVTLVKNIDLYAVVWNNESAVTHKLKFEKYTEENRSISRKYGNYTFVASWRSVGYREVSGVLPFSLYQFYDWVEGTWYTPAGYFKTAAGGAFTIIYGSAVYVTDGSYYELTDPTMRVCSFQSRTEGSGTPLASVRAEGRAIQTACDILATRLDTIAIIAYNAWLGRSGDARGSRNTVTACDC